MATQRASLLQLSTNKKILAVAICGVLEAPTPANAIDVAVSGQVNRAIMWADDGRQSDVFLK